MDGNVEDTDAFMEAMRSVELEDSPLGPQSLDEFGNPDTNVYIRELVARGDGQVWNVVHRRMARARVPEVIPGACFGRRVATALAT